MKIEYQKVTVQKPKNCFKIDVIYEHGDADSSSENNIILREATEHELVGYLEKFREIEKMIDNNRSYGKELPDDFEELIKYKNYIVPVELDDYAKMHMSGYYASMRIKSINYFNENGEEFFVTIKD